MASRKQRPTLASDPVDVPRGMSAFADLYARSQEPTPDPRTRLGSSTRNVFLCDKNISGCYNAENHATHPTLEAYAADTRLEVWRLRSFFWHSRSLPVLRAGLENPIADKDVILAITKQVAGRLGRRSYSVFSETDLAEALIFELLEHPRVTTDVLEVIVTSSVTPELALTLSENDRVTDRLKVLMAMTALRTGSRHQRDVTDAVRHFGGRIPRVALALYPLKDWGAEGDRKLLKFSRASLARFFHCESDAVEMMESLAPSWSGSPEEFVDMIAMVLGKKRDQKH